MESDETEGNESGFDEESNDPDEIEECSCCFCDARFDSTRDCFAHLRTQHHFNFHAYKHQLGLDEYQCLRLLNYLRSEGKGENLDRIRAHLDQEVQRRTSSPTATLQMSCFTEDRWLIPVDETDPMLFHYDVDSSDVLGSEEEKEGKEPSLASVIQAQAAEIDSLREQISQMKITFQRIVEDPDLSLDPSPSVFGASPSDSSVPGRHCGENATFLSRYSDIALHQEVRMTFSLFFLSLSLSLSFTVASSSPASHTLKQQTVFFSFFISSLSLLLFISFHSILSLFDLVSGFVSCSFPSRRSKFIVLCFCVKRIAHSFETKLS